MNLRPQAVVTQLLGELGNLDFADVHLLVSQRLVQVAEPGLTPMCDMAAPSPRMGHHVTARC
jgi:hypothetical protein